ncbi:hypothetical protein FE840_020745 (plasmid) [Peteryoungia desertarenae]|uniref:Uncharacterized protein n=1 Tax=Peteryoungia desertarenae TaxID=1813451 RepID=A0ABX6QUQ3_9HYPH|nr:hypothetical protein [Peteryoungia desertarenae]QLF72067.1 hypothetical protein FE840_020745 [Peteryoungia desertarenae]
MLEDPRKALDLRVSIALSCLRKTTIRAFAGRGPSRRREPQAITQIADQVAAALMVSLMFCRDGTPVIRSRIAHHIATVMQGIPDGIAREWAGLDATARDKARQHIADQIVWRLWERYTVTLQARAVVVPTAKVWCGVAQTDPE